MVGDVSIEDLTLSKERVWSERERRRDKLREAYMVIAVSTVTISVTIEIRNPTKLP
jgi:hypothetical protein